MPLEVIQMQDNKAIAVRHNIVVKANDLIQKSRFSLSLQQQKIVLYLISQIQPKDEDFKLYEFNIQDFCRVCGIDETSGKNYKALKQAIKGIRDKSLWITLPDESESLVSWIEKTKILPKSGKIQIKLDEDMKPFLLQLKSNFTRYELIWTLSFKSKYSIRLYEYIKSIHYKELETYVREIPIDRLKELMGTEYKEYRDFHSRALKPAVQEINEYSDKILTYEPIREGRKVSAIRFTISTKDAMERLKLSNQIEQELGTDQLTLWEQLQEENKEEDPA